MEKLQNGDYCENLTKEQFEELGEIQGNCYLTYETSEMETDGDFIKRALSYREAFNKLSHTRVKHVKKKLSFEDFKQRAINTFKN